MSSMTSRVVNARSHSQHDAKRAAATILEPSRNTGEIYRDLGADYFTHRDPERQIKRLVNQLQRLGHHVTLTEGAAAA